MEEEEELLAAGTEGVEAVRQSIDIGGMWPRTV